MDLKSEKLAAVVRAHEERGRRVVLGMMNDRQVLYVEWVRNGRRYGPDGIVLSTDPKLAEAQALEYLKLS